MVIKKCKVSFIDKLNQNTKTPQQVADENWLNEKI